MTLLVTHVLQHATSYQEAEALHWTADQLSVPVSTLSLTVAVAYVIAHFKKGDLEGWPGFVTDLQPATNRR